MLQHAGSGAAGGMNANRESGAYQSPTVARITRRVAPSGARSYWLHSIGDRPPGPRGPVGPHATATAAAVCAARLGARAVVWAWGRDWSSRGARRIPRRVLREAAA